MIGSDSSEEVHINGKYCDVSVWEQRPKYWQELGYGEWNYDVVKDCNKPKGCLVQCGMNSSREMVRCDSCGKWCHFK